MFYELVAIEFFMKMGIVFKPKISVLKLTIVLTFFIPDVLDEEGLRDNFLASQNNRKKESFYFLTNIDNGHLAKVYSSRH